MELTGVLVAVLVSLIIVLLKYLICHCIVKNRVAEEEDRSPIITRQRNSYGRMREEPPTFDEALRCSVPISYIEIEEPPPTYQEFINAGFEDDFMGASVNPSDSLTLERVTKSSSVV